MLRYTKAAEAVRIREEARKVATEGKAVDTAAVAAPASMPEGEQPAEGAAAPAADGLAAPAGARGIAEPRGNAGTVSSSRCVTGLLWVTRYNRPRP